MEDVDNNSNAKLNQNIKEDFDSRLREKYHTFSKNQKRIAEYILNNKQVVLQSSITTLARKIGTTPSTITRCCQAMRYKGFSELKYYMKNDLFLSVNNTKVVEKNHSLIDTIQNRLNRDIDALKNTMLLMDELELKKAISYLVHADKVYFYGEGGTGSSAQLGYHLFLQIGVTSNCFTDASLMLMSAVHLTSADVVIGMSYSGCTEHVIDVVRQARKHKTPVIIITAYPQSPLAKLSNALLSYSCEIEDDLLHLHTARICEVAIIGVLQSGIVDSMVSSRDSRLKDLKLAITGKRTK